MARIAMFEGLIVDEKGRPVQTGWVGPDICYIVDDAGFLRHIDAAQVDREVLRFFKAQAMAEKEIVVRTLLQMMGKDDIFTKTTLEYQIAHMDEAIRQPIPPQARALLRSLGFKIVIDLQGHLADVQWPETTGLDDLPGLGDLGDL